MHNVWLIRHGESEANAGLPTLNPVKTPLTSKGHRQAQQIARCFTQPPDLIVTSPYWRTQQTAQPTRERFPDVPHTEWQVQEFTYLAPLRYEGSTIEQRRPPSDAYWLQNDPVYVDGAGAESFANLIERAQVTHRQICQLQVRQTAIFTHGRYIRAILWLLLAQLTNAPAAEITARRMRQFQHFINSFAVPNCSIVKLHVEGSEIWFTGIETVHLLEADLLEFEPK
jgi:2,3-bisphosphoglycerate-dependent phosphoglycerate mutase